MPESLAIPRPDQAASLYREHGAALRAFIGARVRDGAAVEDLCQETFAAALAGGVPEDGAGRWLFGIARNKVLKHARDRRPTAELVVEPPARAAGPGEALGRSEERARVRQAVAALEEDLREVVLLRYEGGLAYQQIAERLGVPPTTVQGRLKRARLQLRASLRAEEGRA